MVLLRIIGALDPALVVACEDIVIEMYLYIVEKVIYGEDLNSHSRFCRRRSEDSDCDTLQVDVYLHEAIHSAPEKQNYSSLNLVGFMKRQILLSRADLK